MYSRKIETVADVQDFISYLIDSESLNFHPDTEFTDYVSVVTGERTYDDQQAARYQQLLESCFNICEKAGVCIYETGLEIFRDRLAV